MHDSWHNYPFRQLTLPGWKILTFGRPNDALAMTRAGASSSSEELVEKEKKRLAAEALAQARAQVIVKLRDNDLQLELTQRKIKESRVIELTLCCERMVLEEEKRTLELSFTRRPDERRALIREDAEKEAIEER